jgi:hypothetical protein
LQRQEISKDLTRITNDRCGKRSSEACHRHVEPAGKDVPVTWISSRISMEPSDGPELRFGARSSKKVMGITRDFGVSEAEAEYAMYI